MVWYSVVWFGIVWWGIVWCGGYIWYVMKNATDLVQVVKFTGPSGKIRLVATCLFQTCYNFSELQGETCG